MYRARMHMDGHSSRSPVLTGPLPLPLCATQHRSHMQLAAAIPLKRSAYWQSGVLPGRLCGTSVFLDLSLSMQMQNTLFFEMYRGFIFGLYPESRPRRSPQSRLCERKKKLKQKREEKKRRYLLAAENTRLDTPTSYQTNQTNQ